MPSRSRVKWRTEGRRALDDIEAAHRAVGGAGPGRRYATEQVNHAYAVLLAAQFQRYCRDLHSECVDHLVAAVPGPASSILRSNLLHDRQLDSKNAQPGSIGAAFNRLGIEFWPEVLKLGAANGPRRDQLETLNAWRNAIAHQNFDPAKLGGISRLGIAQVRSWRRSCEALTLAFDAVLRAHLLAVAKRSPW